MPVATGYVRLATLEWANEVAKAARGTTSVATIELPEDRQGRQPHAPGSVCLAHVRILAQPSIHGKRADSHLPATVVRSQTATRG
jgi:hypothetical protein